MSNPRAHADRAKGVHIRVGGMGVLARGLCVTVQPAYPCTRCPANERCKPSSRPVTRMSRWRIRGRSSARATAAAGSGMILQQSLAVAGPAKAQPACRDAGCRAIADKGSPAGYSSGHSRLRSLCFPLLTVQLRTVNVGASSARFCAGPPARVLPVDRPTAGGDSTQDSLGSTWPKVHVTAFWKKGGGKPGENLDIPPPSRGGYRRRSGGKSRDTVRVGCSIPRPVYDELVRAERESGIYR
jgi:hypothetical protein